ncbi:MAG: M56 family metallopeptidase [Planctomycetota bacterium]
MNASFVLDCLITQTWQVMLIGVVVWVVARWWTRDRPHLSHALWLLVLVKCVTPPLWSSPTSPFSWRPSTTSPVVDSESIHPPGKASAPMVRFQTVGKTNQVGNAFFDGNPESKRSTVWQSPTMPTLCVALWVLGMSAVILIAITRWFLLWRLVQRQNISTPNELRVRVQKLAATLRVTRRVQVRVLESPIGPAVVGWFRPTILLPRSLIERNQLRHRDLLIVHELIHVRRGDLWFAALQTIAQAVLWFHPIAWLAGGQLRKESERFCDEETIADFRCSPASYARMLLDVLEAKHGLRVFPASPGVRPVDITANRLERIMRLGNGIHKDRRWWNVAVMVLGTVVVLPGAASDNGQNADKVTGSVGNELETAAIDENWNLDKQIILETKLIQMPTRLLDELKLAWVEDADQTEHCVLSDEDHDTLTKALSEKTDVTTKSSPRVTTFDGQNASIEQSQRRTFVKSWKPFEGQANITVTTMSPVTEDVTYGWKMQSKATCREDSEGIRVSVHIEQTSIVSVETSVFTYEHDIGGEPHPIQLPKTETNELKADVDLEVGGALVFHEPDDRGNTQLTTVRCVAVLDTPEIKEHVGGVRDPRPAPAIKTPTAIPFDSGAMQLQEPPVANVYVDCGFDFTREELELIASRHDQIGFDSVRIRNGRLHVLAQELARVEAARWMIESKIPRQVLVIRGGNDDETSNHDLLVSAMRACGIPCRFEGDVNYTIQREHVELQASPLEVTYSDQQITFRLKGDQGEIRAEFDSDETFALFQGKVILEIAEWRATVDSLEMDESGCVLRGNMLIERQDGSSRPILKSGEVRIDYDFESLEDVIASLTKE